MEEKIIKAGKTDVTFYNNYTAYFIKESPEHSIISPPSPDGLVEITMNQAFDYKKVNYRQWLIFIDLNFTVKGFFSTYVRSSFYLRRGVKKLFTEEIIEPIMQESLATAAVKIPEEYTKHKISFDNSIIPFNNDTVKNNMVKETIQIFNEHRLEKEIANGEKLLPDGLTIPCDDIAKLIIQGTLIIIDKVFFSNEAFDWNYNLKILEPVFPITSYMTMKAECLAIEKTFVKLNWYSGTYFLICIDIALQLLLGEHAERLEQSIEKHGMTEKTRKEFIRHAGHVLTMLKQQLKSANINIGNLEVIYDWNKLIR